MKTQWPWISALIAIVAIFNPVGWVFVTAAIRYSPTDWLRDLAVLIVASGTAILFAMGLVEWLLRRRHVAKSRAAAADRADG